jgi:hypothetical protein
MTVCGCLTVGKNRRPWCRQRIQMTWELETFSGWHEIGRQQNEQRMGRALVLEINSISWWATIRAKSFDLTDRFETG